MRPRFVSRWIRAAGRFLGQTRPSPALPRGAVNYLVLPAAGTGGWNGRLSSCASALLERARQLAEATCGPTRLLAFDARRGQLHSFPQGENLSLASLFAAGTPTLLFNVSFLLRQSARPGQPALHLSPDGQTPEAVAASAEANRAELLEVLARLVSVQAPPEGGLCSPLGPPYLNRALAELLYCPACLGEVSSPERLRQALLAQRDRSAVPWLFNLLVNDIETRTARAVLDSFPPEIHLSLTGRCNIECRFCPYAHRQAYSDFVTVEQVARLSLLRHAHTLRLSSGLGEPTINPHLPAIIHHLARTFPHLALNFFSNGLTLRRPGLIEALVGRVSWINVSLNAASPETWEELCQRDALEQVLDGLKALQQAKQAQRARLPVVYGSMVLTRHNLHELPRMPELCRRHGVDRFTAIPFFSHGYAGLTDRDRYGADDSFHLCRDRYDELFYQTVEHARQHAVTIELPLPAEQKTFAFGLEARPIYNFAGHHEPPYYWLPWLLDALVSRPAVEPPCVEVYHKALYGSRNRKLHPDSPQTHVIYPCLGPMSAVDFPAEELFEIADVQGYLRLWNHPMLVRLRAAQSTVGLCRVCDSCRGMDSRDPHNFATLDELLRAEWPREQALIPAGQLRLRAG